MVSNINHQNTINELYSSIYKNVKNYSSLDLSISFTALCIVTKVYKNLKADVYVPSTSSKYISVPIMFNSLSENIGDIVPLEENSLSLLVGTSDGKVIVVGGLSLSDSYMVKNILHGETERYTNKSCFKQDLLGNQTFMSNALVTNVMSASGDNINCANDYLSNYLSEESYKSHVVINGQVRFLNYRKIYCSANICNFYNVENILNSPSVAQEIKNDNEKIINKTLNYLNDIQNFSNDINLSNSVNEINMKINTLTDKINKDYKIKKDVSIIIEEGSAINKEVLSQHDIIQLNSDDFIIDEFNSPIVYRMRIFNDKQVIFSFSISQDGNVYFNEEMPKNYFIEIEHNIDDYPIVECFMQKKNSKSLFQIKYNVEFIDKNTVKIFPNKFMGTIKNVKKNNDHYEAHCDGGNIIIINISESNKKMIEKFNHMIREYK